MKNHRGVSQLMLGIALMLLSSLSFSLMSACIKLTGANISIFQKVFFRNFFTVFVAFIVVRRQRLPLFGRAEHQKYLLIRSVCGLLAVIGFFYAVSNMKLTDATALSKTAPFFVILFSAVFLKEHVRPMHMLAMMFAAAGCFFIIKPQLQSSLIPSIAALMTALLTGLTYTMLRLLRDKEHPSTIVFTFAFFSSITMLPLMLLTWTTPSLKELIFLMLTGFFALGGQYAVTYAYKLTSASDVSIYIYSMIVFSLIIGFVIWKEVPDSLALLGSGMVIISGYVNYRATKQKMPSGSSQ